MNLKDTVVRVWGPYASYDDIARFSYGRMFWRDPKMRARLLRHWLDERHPYRERFIEQRELVEKVLNSTTDPVELDAELRTLNTSLRCVTREIPPVFGSFYKDSEDPADLRPAPAAGC